MKAKKVKVACNFVVIGMALSSLQPLGAIAAETDFTVVIRDHRFQPNELKVPADTKIKLKIDNQDASPEEFESKSLNREKVIAGKSSATILVGPLKPGRYPFYGEFNEKTAIGAIVVE